MVTKLSDKCTEFLEANLCAESAAQLLEQSMLYDEKHLKKKVLSKIQEEASTVLMSEDFVSLSKEALKEVLQLDLQINSELEVLQATMKWAERKCEELNKSIDGANLRKVLGDNLFLIRFPTMSVDNFNDTVVPYDVLTASEGFQVLRYLTASSKPENLPFSAVPRFNPYVARSIVISSPYVQISGIVQAHRPLAFATNIKGHISRQVKLKRIFVHPFMPVNNVSMY